MQGRRPPKRSDGLLARNRSASNAGGASKAGGATYASRASYAARADVGEPRAEAVRMLGPAFSGCDPFFYVAQDGPGRGDARETIAELHQPRGIS